MRIKKVFCVIDPTTTNQTSLDRAAMIARNASASLHVYVCISSYDRVSGDRDTMREAETARHKAWLSQITENLKSDGLKVTVEVDSNDNWREAIAPAAQRAKADLIVKANYRRSVIQRRLFQTSDWVLLRSAHCPVLFVKAKRTKPIEKVLAAVNLNASDKAHKALNDIVIDHAGSIAKDAGAELHAVNAYSGSENFIHPPDLAKKLGIPRQNAHVDNDDPEELVSKVARKLGSPLLVIGSIARKGVTGTVVGNTAERILDTLDCEILVIIQPRN